MSNDTASAGYIEIMRLVNEMDAQGGRFKADVDNRITGLLQRQNNRPEKTKASEKMASSQAAQRYIANYVRTVRDLYNA